MVRVYRFHENHCYHCHGPDNQIPEYLNNESVFEVSTRQFQGR